MGRKLSVRSFHSVIFFSKNKIKMGSVWTVRRSKLYRTFIWLCVSNQSQLSESKPLTWQHHWECLLPFDQTPRRDAPSYLASAISLPLKRRCFGFRLPKGIPEWCTWKLLLFGLVMHTRQTTIIHLLNKTSLLSFSMAARCGISSTRKELCFEFTDKI